MPSPRLGVLGLRPADLLAAARGGSPRPLVGGVLAAVAAADVGLLEGGVLPTRVSTRSAVSRSVNRAAPRRAVGIEACKPLADLYLLRADLGHYRR